jgi:hypothetical protein
LEYEKQIQNTANENLKRFRTDEVTDLKFSITACDVYFEGDLDKSIECVYKKDKLTIVKKHHYEEALKTVRGIENEFKDPNFLQNTVIIA